MLFAFSREALSMCGEKVGRGLWPSANCDIRVMCGKGQVACSSLRMWPELRMFYRTRPVLDQCWSLLGTIVSADVPCKTSHTWRTRIRQISLCRGPGGGHHRVRCSGVRCNGSTPNFRLSESPPHLVGPSPECTGLLANVVR